MNVPVPRLPRKAFGTTFGSDAPHDGSGEDRMTITGSPRPTPERDG